MAQAAAIAPDKAIEEQKTTHALRRSLSGFALVASLAAMLIYGAAAYATGQLNPWDTEAAGTLLLYGVPSAFVVFFVALLTLVSPPSRAPYELPEQTAYGDAHWATLDELLAKTSLLDGEQHLLR